MSSPVCVIVSCIKHFDGHDALLFHFFHLQFPTAAHLPFTRTALHLCELDVKSC